MSDPDQSPQPDRRPSPQVEVPYPRYDSTSKAWWRDFKHAKRFGSAR